MIEGDVWNGVCVGLKVNCFEEDGFDFDFGVLLIFVSVGDCDLIFVGQKFGMIYGIDLDLGEIVWEQCMGMGGFNGGVYWGMVVVGDCFIVLIIDIFGNCFMIGELCLGLYLFDLLIGKLQWSIIYFKICIGKCFCYFYGLLMVIMMMFELVFVGSLDGLLSIYSVVDGECLWIFQMCCDFEMVNGVEVSGGMFDFDGVVFVGNQLFVNLGYDKWGEFVGNVFLFFEVMEEDGVVVDD